LFSESDRLQVNASVRLAESRTSAEIVPVVATASGRYDRAEDLIGLWLGVLLMIAVSVLWPSPAMSADSGNWGSDPAVPQTLKLIVTMLAGFILGAVVGSRVSWLRRLFTPFRHMADEVRLSARSVFFDQRIHHTAAGGGMLIYVSLFERTAVILADHRVVSAIGQSTLDELCRSLTEQLRRGSPAEALCKTIQNAGNKLSAVMPRAQDDVNELSDSLVTMD
jgi:putative membrane protein